MPGLCSEMKRDSIDVNDLFKEKALRLWDEKMTVLSREGHVVLCNIYGCSVHPAPHNRDGVDKSKRVEGGSGRRRRKKKCFF